MTVIDRTPADHRTQAREALAIANVKRSAIREIKRQVQVGELVLADLLRDPPPALAHMSVFEVMMLRRQLRGQSSDAARQKIGGRAVADQVNVLIPLGRASQRTRNWAADNLPQGPQATYVRELTR